MVPLTHLKRLRERRGLSQRDLAAKAGVAHSTVVHLEAGKPARFVTRRKLARALGVTPGDLVEEVR